MNGINADDLDRWITGNYGEDAFRDEQEEPEEEEHDSREDERIAEFDAAELLAEADALDAAYADSEAWHAERAEGAEEIETEDPVRDGWIGKDGRP